MLSFRRRLFVEWMFVNRRGAHGCFHSRPRSTFRQFEFCRIRRFNTALNRFGGTRGITNSIVLKARTTPNSTMFWSWNRVKIFPEQKQQFYFLLWSIVRWKASFLRFNACFYDFSPKWKQPYGYKAQVRREKRSAGRRRALLLKTIRIFLLLKSLTIIARVNVHFFNFAPLAPKKNHSPRAHF